MKSDSTKYQKVIVDDHYDRSSLSATASLVIGLAQTILSVISFTHVIGLIFGATLFIYGLIASLLSNPKRVESRFLKMTTSQNDQNEDDSGEKALRGVLGWINKLHIMITLLLLTIKIFNLRLAQNLSSFPTQCLPDPGCARVSQQFNHRDDEVDPKDIITVEGISKEVFTTTLLDCITLDFQGTVKSEAPSTLHPENTLIHTLFVSGFFGFVDDMYLEVVDCNGASNKLSLQVQSALRIGKGDLGVNPQRVSDMYSCIAYNIEQHLIVSTGRVC
jgi:uncharacterized protein (DUF1499 family)